MMLDSSASATSACTLCGRESSQVMPSRGELEPAPPAPPRRCLQVRQQGIAATTNCTWSIQMLLITSTFAMISCIPLGDAARLNHGLNGPVKNDILAHCDTSALDPSCDPGRDVARCGECVPGEYCRTPDATESINSSFVCEPCPMGCFQPEPGQQICLVCHAGNFSAACKEKRCSQCPAGHFTPKDNHAHISCEECDEGTNQTHVGKDSCVPCPLSTMCNITACIDCHSCPLGYGSYENRTDCHACRPGRYRDSGRKACTDCRPGFHCNDTACVSCEICHAGSSAHPGSRLCDPCSLGHYQDQPGQGQCHKCPRGFYSIVLGSVQCRECGEGYYCPTADNPPVLCPGDAYCPSGSEAPQYCPALYNLNSSNDGCAMSGGLIGIIAATILANVIIVTLLVWYYYRKKRLYTGESQPLVWRKETLSKDPPVYDGY